MDERLEWKVKVVKEAQSLKARSPIYVTLERFGNTLKTRHPSNVLSLMIFKFDVPRTCSREVQPLNAALPTTSTFSGRVNFVTLTQSRNALSPISVTNLSLIYSGTVIFPVRPLFPVMVVSPPLYE